MTTTDRFRTGRFWPSTRRKELSGSASISASRRACSWPLVSWVSYIVGERSQLRKRSWGSIGTRTAFARLTMARRLSMPAARNRRTPATVRGKSSFGDNSRPPASTMTAPSSTTSVRARTRSRDTCRVKASKSRRSAKPKSEAETIESGMAGRGTQRAVSRGAIPSSILKSTLSKKPPGLKGSCWARFHSMSPGMRRLVSWPWPGPAPGSTARAAATARPGKTRCTRFAPVTKTKKGGKLPPFSQLRLLRLRRDRRRLSAHVRRWAPLTWPRPVFYLNVALMRPQLSSSTAVGSGSAAAPQSPVSHGMSSASTNLSA